MTLMNRMNRDGYCQYCMEPISPGEQVCGVCRHPASVNALQHHLKPGTVLRQGKYLVGRALGEGGFGITYIGRDLVLNMRIAIKEYYPRVFVCRDPEGEVRTVTDEQEAFDFPKGVTSFLEEAQKMAMFAGKQEIVNVRDFFEENGTAYIVMEYLDGMTLKDYLTSFGRIPVNTFLLLIDPILLALDVMHQKYVIHRDISPDNIMFLKNGSLKLLDFGAAKELLDTKSLSVTLKHGYAPMEQYGSKNLQGAWTDVYAVCATIYACITGVRPDSAVNRVFDDGLVSPSALGIGITTRQEKALLHGLSILPENRTRSIRDLRRELGLEEGIHGGTLSWPVVEKVAELPDGGRTKYYQDGTKTEYHPNGSITVRKPNGEKTEYVPGKDRTIYDPNGGKTVCDHDGNLKQYIKKTVKMPTQAANVVYDGRVHRYAVPSTEDYTVAAVHAVDPGSYDVVIALRDKATMMWENGSSDDLVHKLVIEAKKDPKKPQEKFRKTPDEEPEPEKKTEGGPGNPPPGSKRRILLYVGVAVVALALLLSGALLARRNSSARMENSLPTERKMASDCVGVLKQEQITGGILDLSVENKTFSEKFKTYLVECQVTVLLEEGKQATYTLELFYEYRSEQWILDDTQSNLK